jgi:hypothetical protein
MHAGADRPGAAVHSVGCAGFGFIPEILAAGLGLGPVWSPARRKLRWLRDFEPIA